MRLKFLVAFILVFGYLISFGQDKNLKTLQSYNFESIFGYLGDDSLNVYCLLGQGFFRTPRSDNFDSLIVEWIEKSPQAYVIPVSSMSPTMTDIPDSKMTYCWIINELDTLNIFLVRQGCFPGGTMQKHTLKYIKSPIFGSFGLFENIRIRRENSKMMRDTKSKVENYVKRKDYNDFIENIIEAENFAKKNKLGIWKDIELKTD